MDAIAPIIDTTVFDPFLYKPDPKAPPLTDAHGKSVKHYAVTNEHESRAMYTILKELDDIGRIVITISGIHGLQIFALRPERVDYCLHIDPNPSQKVFLRIVLNAIGHHTNPEDAIDEILHKYRDGFNDDREYKKLKAYFTKEHLFTPPECWKKLKRAVHEDRILSLSIDLRNNLTVDHFCRAIVRSRLVPDTFYISNCHAKKWLGFGIYLTIDKILKLNPNNKLLIVYAKDPRCPCRKSLIVTACTITETETPLQIPSCSRDLAHKIRCIRYCFAQIKLLYIDIFDNEIPAPSTRFARKLDLFTQAIEEINRFDRKISTDMYSLLHAIYEADGSVDDFTEETFLAPKHQTIASERFPLHSGTPPIPFVIFHLAEYYIKKTSDRSLSKQTPSSHMPSQGMRKLKY